MTAEQPDGAESQKASCLFCRIVRGEIPAQVVYQDADVIAIRDINPQAPVHLLVLPREHVESLHDLKDPLVAGRLALAAANIARRDGFADRGYRAVFNTRDDGGQTVGHLHLHVLAGRPMHWPPG
jgi:histidine triad (HIT) family protein